MNRLQGFGPFTLALFTLLAAACSSTSNDASNDPAESADELRGACGGIANLACRAGYSCSITEKHPDAMGVCKKVCGGIANLQCSSSYECVITDTCPDATGVCTKKAADAMCGGIANVQCAAGYDCVITATYPDASGLCKKKSSAAACTAPSDCKGFLPASTKACGDGTSASAHWACEQGACAIEYCPTKPACTKASDCKGLLPQSCEVCNDGSNGCAHWACDQGACAINYCN